MTYLPAVSESYTLWYNYRWMRVSRAIESHCGGWSTRETLTIRYVLHDNMARTWLNRPSVMTRDHGVLAGILQDAKNGHIEAQKDKIAIFVSDRHNRYAFIHSNQPSDVPTKDMLSLASTAGGNSLRVPSGLSTRSSLTRASQTLFSTMSRIFLAARSGMLSEVFPSVVDTYLFVSFPYSVRSRILIPLLVWCPRIWQDISHP